MIYYNDIDPACIQRLEKNVRLGHLPKGTIDGRDVREVKAEELAGFVQAHFFAGIGGFPLGLKWAGVPESLSLWTGGDPCQGNSKAGGVWKREHEDVASAFLGLIESCRPDFVLRENPSDGRTDSLWTWHRYRAALSAIGYDVLPFRLRACCVGSHHKGERLFLLAVRSEADCERLERLYRQRLPQGELCGASGHESPEQRENCLPTPGRYRDGNGISGRVDRTRLLGNSVDPRIVQVIGCSLMEALTSAYP